jgi:hypothetical protein
MDTDPPIIHLPRTSREPARPQGPPRPAGVTALLTTRPSAAEAHRSLMPSIAITPIRRPWLPEQATPAGSAMTLAACKLASGALLSRARRARYPVVSGRKVAASKRSPAASRPDYGPVGRERLPRIETRSLRREPGRRVQKIDRDPPRVHV